LNWRGRFDQRTDLMMVSVWAFRIASRTHVADRNDPAALAAPCTDTL